MINIYLPKKKKIKIIHWIGLSGVKVDLKVQKEKEKQVDLVDANHLIEIHDMI